jgi:hypothetical protein
MGWALSIDRTDISKAKLVETPHRALNPGEARLGVKRFALTANNVTYAVFGDVMRYWDFFSSADSGRLPVWGFADVVESTVEGLQVGERIYGYVPASDELIVEPGRISANAFNDMAAHRQDLPAAYNRYIRTASDPGYAKAREGLQMALQPLFITSWLIDLHLRDTQYGGAEYISLTSASSKTALALAYLLHADKPAGIRVEAITSERSRPFVEKTGFYDQITLYPDLNEVKADPRRLVVDFAGDASVNRAIHGALKDDLIANIRVGASHWTDSAPASDLPGPKPTFFFAPDHVAQRMKAWGSAEFGKRYSAAWSAFAEAVDGMFTEQSMSGGEGCLSAYNDLVAGKAPASAALIVEA